MKKLFLSTLLGLISVVANASTPSIMVVPFRSGSETFADVLNRDPERRMAVDKVNEGLRKQGIDPIDLLAMTQITIKAGEYESGVTEDSRDKQLLDQSGADVYIVVDTEKKSSSAGNSVSLSLKAYNRATGSIIASKVGFSPAFRTNSYDKLYVVAVNQAIDAGFISEINAAFEKSQAEGSSVSIRIALGTNSSVMSLIQHQTPKGRLGDSIRNWMRAHAVNGEFHLKGTMAELISYDKVLIPPTTTDGYRMYPEDFASELINFLYTDLQISAEERIDGSTIYISIF